MRINLWFLLLFAVSFNLSAAAKIMEWKTQQGVPVYYVQTQGLPLVDVRVVFDAGSARDGKQYGLASLTSTLLNASAGQWSADEVLQRFESVGAQYSTGISQDMAWLSLRSLTEKEFLEPALQTLKVLLAQPAFNAEDFERDKNRTLAALKQRKESPAEIASQFFYKALYPEHPYGNPVDGTLETVAALTPEDVKAFFKDYYVAANAMIVIVGDLSPVMAKHQAEALMSALPIGQKPEPIQDVVASNQAGLQHINFPSSQTHVLAGLLGMDVKDPDYFDLYVGNHILGGGGLVSLLFEEIREKRGLAYSAYSYFAPFLKRGPFVMGLQTRNDQTEQALGVMQSTLQHFIESGPTLEQLMAAKNNITGGFAMRFDTNSKLTGYVATIGFYQLPLDYLDTFQQKIEQVTVDSVKAALTRRIDPKQLSMITVGAKP
jgi:zinc protease